MRRVDIDWDEVENYFKLGATLEDVLHLTGLDKRTVQRRCKSDRGVKVHELIEKCIAYTVLSVRSSLIKKAKNGNTNAMMYFLNNYGGAMTEKDKQLLEIKRQELELKRELSGKIEELATSSEEVAKIVAEVRSAYVD